MHVRLIKQLELVCLLHLLTILISLSLSLSALLFFLSLFTIRFRFVKLFPISGIFFLLLLLLFFFRPAEPIVKMSDGFNGADLRNVCTEAGLFAFRAKREVVVQEDFNKAVRKLAEQKKLEGTLTYQKV